MEIKWKTGNESDPLFQLYKCLFENKYHFRIRADRYHREFVISNLESSAKGKYSALDTPVWVGIKLTNYCNLKCRHCWTVNHGFVPELSNIKNMLDKLYRSHIKFVGFSGGELFTRPDILEILEYSKKRGLIVELFTNATLIDDEMIESLKTILDRKTDVIQISLDGISESALKYQRGIQGPDKIIHVINRLVAEGFCVRVSYVVTSANVSDLVPTFIEMDRSGVAGFSVSAVYPIFKGIAEHKKLDMMRYYQELYKIINIPHQMELKYFLQIDFFERVSHYIESLVMEDRTQADFDSGFVSWFIDANGSVYPEFHLEYDELCGGNIYSDDIKDIADRFKKMPILANGRSLEQTTCRNCKFKSLCLNHSYDQAYAKYKMFNKKNPFCRIP